MNVIIITGNLTRDPETRSTNSGQQVCNFTVAVNPENKTSPNAITQFMQVSAWNKLADICSRFLAKGRKVAVVGEARPTIYTKKDGTPECAIVINASKVEFLTPKGEEGEMPGIPQSNAYSPADDGGYVRVDPDELPF